MKLEVGVREHEACLTRFDEITKYFKLHSEMHVFTWDLSDKT